jgi:hypothetical protein
MRKTRLAGELSGEIDRHNRQKQQGKLRLAEKRTDSSFNEPAELRTSSHGSESECQRRLCSKEIRKEINHDKGRHLLLEQ